MLLFCGSLAVRLALSPWLDARFLTFYPAIASAALVFGWTQGVLVLLLSAFAAWYFFLEPFTSFQVPDENNVVALLSFLVAGGLIVSLGGAMREVIRRLEGAKRVQEELFRELQHRVANNFQMVLGTLRHARRKFSEDAAAADAFVEAEDRIWAMAQLHRRLHDGTAYVNGLEPLLNDVLTDVFSNMRVNVRVEIQIETNLSFNQMTALTLLVNEAAINAGKHVFAKGNGSSFEVSLREQNKGRLQLAIRDDGPGLDPLAIDDPKKLSLGMSIMRALAKQLGGQLQVVGVPGMTLRLEFCAAS